MGDNENKEKRATASSASEEGHGKTKKQWKNAPNEKNSGAPNLSNSNSSQKGKGKKNKCVAKDSSGKRKEQLEAKANIEDIFSNLKGKEKKATKVGNETRPIKKNSEKSGLHGGPVHKKAKRLVAKGPITERARTSDGLPIYSMEELKMGQGGYTKDCPFECSCCF
ncbi:conserved protein, unknown function [Plasmodium knowlesi strain H]|uniref:Uncharacterized protein n=2 Tax=Plasmodium knowlesi TaxID=5850 RepID=B3L4Z5_PLAKH|nr:conserved protein, unknown function [Plasmodium knowlesi strain H]OTN65109.1 Uncharacterized protein PKNOH_S120135700 [Plasmodium knowlesi]CAA9988216.1 conserved protein, unknown function [Plasmodium knowlesi strain H]VVS77690.1 conserved protein, unknown function [Plasmodium knowlesi strain H]|eukprot:XP_002259193.1 hypothetical protein, conserved in Plasmodium species [Plasmodium knowlesi strain H]